MEREKERLEKETVPRKITLLEYFFSEKKTVEFSVWVAGLLLGIFAATLLAVIYCKPAILEFMTYDCFVRTRGGFLCPGCGGTRAFFAFLKGHFLLSVCYHPVVPYMGVIYVVFMLRGLLHFLSKGRFAFMRFRLGYVYVAIAITILQFLVKNICLLVFHIVWI